MTISPSGPDRPRVDAPAPARAHQPVARVSDEPSSGPSAPVAQRHRDVLDLSPAARAFVARAEDEGTLSAERVLELRQRVLDGAYDAPAILDAVASKLWQSGDLR